MRDWTPVTNSDGSPPAIWRSVALLASPARLAALAVACAAGLSVWSADAAALGEVAALAVAADEPPAAAAPKPLAASAAKTSAAAELAGVVLSGLKSATGSGEAEAALARAPIRPAAVDWAAVRSTVVESRLATPTVLAAARGLAAPSPVRRLAPGGSRGRAACAGERVAHQSGESRFERWGGRGFGRRVGPARGVLDVCGLGRRFELRRFVFQRAQQGGEFRPVALAGGVTGRLLGPRRSGGAGGGDRYGAHKLPFGGAATSGADRSSVASATRIVLAI